MGEYWEIKKGKVDSARFFEALWTHFPEATTLYVEGGSIAPDLKNCYRTHREEGSYLPRAQTMFPRSEKFRCRFSANLVDALAVLAEQHAEPELLDHLTLYRDSEELLVWHDAFADVLLVSRTVPESVASSFAADLGLGYSSSRAG
jgi:hypothetical protein